jgi:two-component system heavy metal sensor histidine kinase CusS
MRRSIAGRLTLWYAATAFVLVLVTAWVQYRTVERDLASEDDQLLIETLTAIGLEGAGSARMSSSMGRFSELGPFVRILDARCHPVPNAAPGSPRTDFPPPDCTMVAGASPALRSWRSPMGRTWRIAQAPIGADSAGRVEVLLDRKSDEDILRRYRRELAFLLPTALLLSLALGYAIARRGLAPVGVLARRVSRIDARSLDERLGRDDAPDEVRPLVVSFNDLLARLSKAFTTLSESSADLAHELRTPLHVLRQQAEIALSRARSVEEYRDVLSSSLEEFDRLRRMVDDTLFLARAEDPRASIDRSMLDVGAELTSVTEFLDAVAAEQEVRLEVDARRGLAVEADRTLLRRAVVNLVSNALRHTPPGGRIVLSSEARDHSVRISVSDTGSGIAPDALPRVFDRHFRVSTGTGRSEGSGLGLSIVRGVMAMHGGAASIESEPGRGTRVTLSFPARGPSAEPGPT